MDRTKELVDEIGSLIKTEVEYYSDKISKLDNEIEDLEHVNEELRDEVRELQAELFSKNEDLSTERMIDQQKYDLLQEHWDHITVEHIEELLKRIGR